MQNITKKNERIFNEKITKKIHEKITKKSKIQELNCKKVIKKS